MKNRFLILFLFSGISVPGALAGVRSIGEPFTVWKKKEIRVCWGTSEDFPKTFAQVLDRKNIANPLSAKKLNPFDEKTKELVRSMVVREYTIERLGVTFTGWKDCQSEVESDVILLTSTVEESSTVRTQSFSSPLPLGQATMGEGGELTDLLDRWVKSKKDRKPYVFLRYTREKNSLKMSPEESLQWTALHEFGHLLGLRHEHAREESEEDLNCMQVNLKSSEKTNRSTEFFGVYDPNSIMSYCYSFLLKYHWGLDFTTSQKLNLVDPSLAVATPLENGKIRYQVRIGLSLGDVHALRCLYRHDLSEKKSESCRPDFDPILNPS